MKKLAKVYEHPDDVDFSVGGGLERHPEITLGGPTFECIWEKEFIHISQSDRFFYNHRDGPFTPRQLEEIKKVTAAKWYCDNSDIDVIQPLVSYPPSPT